ncbi:phospholipase, partial [Pseudomonas sp. GW247-3R2A]
MTTIVQNNLTLNNWMASTPAIDTLSLCELTLPGTHNA